MDISPPATIKLNAKCSQCGQPVTLNEHAAKYVRAGKQVLCSECRGNGRQWSKEAYQEYLESDHWAAFKKRAFRHYDRKCYLCGDDNGRIDLHHNDYSRLGCELISDVIPLCRACHTMFHEVGK